MKKNDSKLASIARRTLSGGMYLVEVSSKSNFGIYLSISAFIAGDTFISLSIFLLTRLYVLWPKEVLDAKSKLENLTNLADVKWTCCHEYKSYVEYIKFLYIFILLIIATYFI